MNKTSDKPTVVVLLSSYNGERYIAEQLDSILAQENVDVRLICRDDGSSDSTVKILNRYATLHPDRINVFSGEGNLGFVGSFGRLLELGLQLYPEAGLMAFADQDDVWMPDKLAVGAKAVMASAGNIPAGYCCRTLLVNERLEPLPQQPRSVHPSELTKERATICNIATGCTMVFNRRAAEIYVQNPVAGNRLHDYLMFMICTFMGHMTYDDTPHIYYRQHGSNQIGKPDFGGRMRKRLEGHSREHRLEKMNRRFADAFAPMLSDDDMKIVLTVADYRSSLFKRLRLLFSPRYKYSSIERNFFFILKVAMGTV